jgi:hypothetical protein
MVLGYSPLPRPLPHGGGGETRKVAVPFGCITSVVARSGSPLSRLAGEGPGEGGDLSARKKTSLSEY